MADRGTRLRHTGWYQALPGIGLVAAVAAVLVVVVALLALGTLWLVAP